MKKIIVIIVGFVVVIGAVIGIGMTKKISQRVAFGDQNWWRV